MCALTISRSTEGEFGLGPGLAKESNLACLVEGKEVPDIY